MEKVDFQFPGHRKRKNKLIDYNLLPDFDTTETYGTDNLHKPVEVIADSMKEIARVYGTHSSLYGINGSTGALHIAMMSAMEANDRVLIQRNSHVATYNGSIIGDFKASYILPQYDPESQVIGGITPEEFENELKKEKFKACLLLHPSFYGICSDLKTIIDIAHKNDVTVIVDEAHAPHLSFSDRLPKSAIELGADLVIHSAHKTLPAITQTAILHNVTNRVTTEKIAQVSRMLQTTSPSYIFMTVVEQAVAYMDSQEGRKKLDDIISYLEAFQEKMNKLEGVTVLGDNQPELFYDRDQTKLMIEIKGIGGARLRDILHKDFSIDMEYADLKHVIGVVTVMNEKEDLLKLADAIETIASSDSYEKIEREYPDMSLIRPETVIASNKAYYAKTETIEIKKAAGRIAASYMTPYPPGIPQLAPGEKIKEEHIELVKELREIGIPIVGPKGENGELIDVIKE